MTETAMQALQSRLDQLHADLNKISNQIGGLYRRLEGTEEFPGIVIRVDRLEQREIDRRARLSAVWTAALTALFGSIAALAMAVWAKITGN